MEQVTRWSLVLCGHFFPRKLHFPSNEEDPGNLCALVADNTSIPQTALSVLKQFHSLISLSANWTVCLLLFASFQDPLEKLKLVQFCACFDDACNVIPLLVWWPVSACYQLWNTLWFLTTSLVAAVVCSYFVLRILQWALPSILHTYSLTNYTDMTRGYRLCTVVVNNGTRRHTLSECLFDSYKKCEPM